MSLPEQTSPSDCAICQLHARIGTAAPGPASAIGPYAIARSELWLLRHHADPAPLVGWLLLDARRHLGGPADFLEKAHDYLAHAPVVRPCLAVRAGIVAGMEARGIGLAVVELGGGRQHADDAIDPAVGLSGVIEVGSAVEAGMPLCMVHAASEAAAEDAIAAVRQAILVADTAPPARPVVLGRVVA